LRKALRTLLVAAAILAVLYFGWRRSPLHQVRSIAVGVEIYAPPERVWQVLTEFDAYRDWNPFITEASGSARVGERISVTVKAGGRATTIHPRVEAAQPERVLRWKGHLFFPGLLDGEHEFLLEPDGPNNTRFLQIERFDGLLVVPFWKQISPATSRGFREMNQALKARAESR
jgi:hypothetical protein